MCEGGQATNPIWLLSRGIRLLHKVWQRGERLLRDMITCSHSSTHFDGTQLPERDFNASCTAYAIKSSWYHLSASQRPSTYCATLTTMSSRM
ncbi:hypothetical protein TNCV_3721361 [Trichonephila clavipes]|nr:hypothetical protein TNCV_3721361 [Trichonephila clavipes]